MIEEILIIDDSQQISSLLADYVLPELGYRPVVASTGRQGLERLRTRLPDLILLDLQLPDISGLDLLRLIAHEGYDVPVILMTAHGSENIAVEAFRLGARNYLIKPFSDTEARAAIDQALRERRLRRDKERLTASLQQRVQELTVLYRIGKSVTGLMDQEQLLERIVEAGVYITQAEEGFLLLRDEHELYLRAAKNLGEQRAQSLRMPIDDSLAGQVVRSGKPVRLDQQRSGVALKVKTGFLVRAILQVPLMVGDQVIGVLAVDNRQTDRPFSENDQYLLAALADYAAIAIENARLYEQARLSEKRYRDLFANAYDLIVMLDRDLQITSINKAGELITGYAAADLVGRPLAALCDPQAWERAAPHFSALLAGEGVAPFELELIRRDHEAVYLEISAQAMQNGAGRPAGLHCIARNLTDRRRLEEQLIQSEKLSAIGQLVAGVAHELNNPLTSVSGYAQLVLRDSGLSDLLRQDIEQIYAQAERAAKIVRNLLIFAREHKPERSLVSINEVLRSALALQAYQLRVDNIRVMLELDEGLPPTTADPHQLQQVFLNLITNARHAMLERGGPGILTLHSSLDPGSAGEPAIVVEVADTGVGISEQNLSKIFNPFFTTKPVGQGTGLGLSICFGIVKEHDGRIWAESQVGVGTRFFISLPLRTLSAITEPAAPSESGPGEPSAALTVLVVDDEEPVVQLVERMLRDLGHQPWGATSGAAALGLLDGASFDVVLTDVRMPGMDGFELVSAVRERLPDLAERVIFITGDTVTPSTRSQIEASGSLTLAKPFAIEQLEASLQSLMRRRSIPS